MLMMSKTGPGYVLQQIFSVNCLVQFFFGTKSTCRKKTKTHQGKKNKTNSIKPKLMKKLNLKQS